MCTHPSVTSRHDGSIRVVICEPDAATRAQLRSLIDRDSVLTLVAESGDWQGCQVELEDMVPDLLIARSELLPPGWPHQEQPDCFSPVVIRLQTACDLKGRSAGSDFISMPANPLAMQHVLNQAVRDIYDRKAKQLLYLVDRYVAGSQTNSAYRPAIKVERNGQQLELGVGEIVSVVAARKYVVIRSTGGEFKLREPIRSLAEKLDPHIFVRIHRSIIVNRRYVESSLLTTPGASFVTLNDGSRYPIGPNYRAAVAETLQAERLRSSSLSPKIV